MNTENKEIENIIFDVDGVFTDGTFYYSKKGKIFKKFGSHDASAVKLCKPFFNLYLISADKKGYSISSRRAKDLGLNLELVSEADRKEWIQKNFSQSNTALMADSFTDIPALGSVSRSFAPSNSHKEFYRLATDKLQSAGGSGAVAEALNILIFEKLNKYLWEIE